MLGASVCLIIIRIIALQSAGYGYTHLLGQVRVLAIGFHTPSPARVTEDIDIRGPESKTFVTVVLLVFLVLVVFGTGLVADHREGLVNGVIVEGSRHGDRLREYGRTSGTSHAVKSLVPPVVSRDSQTLDGGGYVHHLADFLLRCQPG